MSRLLGLSGRRRLARALRPALARTERVVAWASTSDGVVVATNLGLWLPGRKDRLGWHQIHKATWTPPELTVVPAVEAGSGSGLIDGFVVVADEPAVTVTLADPGDVPVEVRTRVNRSIAHTSHHELPDGGGVRVVARRVPGVNGVAWHVRYDEGTDGSDPAVIEATAGLFVPPASAPESHAPEADAPEAPAPESDAPAPESDEPPSSS
jgi:hypothetical protein